MDCYAEKAGEAGRNQGAGIACVGRTEGTTISTTTSGLLGTPTPTSGIGGSATGGVSSPTPTGGVQGLIVGRNWGVMMGVSALVVFVAGGMGL
jgi:hypothetical protein